jgi:guanylate cyclase
VTHLENRPRLLARIINSGAAPADTEDERAAKAILIAASLLIAALSNIWSITLLALHRPWSALIPFVYQVFTYVGVFGTRRHFAAYRDLQLGIMLVLPALLQGTLGGFVSSGAMIVWAFAPAISSQLFGARPWPWVVGFVAVAIGSGIADPWLEENVTPLPRAASLVFFVINVIGAVAATFLAVRFFIAQRDLARAELETERARSEQLLLNVLPEPIARRLKDGESTIADAADQVTVLFADLVDFTSTAGGMSPDDLVGLLNEVFTTLDRLSARQGLEKIKTIGDAYMVVGGLPSPRPDHAPAVAEFALEAMAAVARMPTPFRMRVGIDTGPVVAGVIGSQKFTYDLWGDTVNIASRMESHGVPGCIQVTERVVEALSGRYVFERRGLVDVKGKGEMPTYFLTARSRADAADLGAAERHIPVPLPP